MCKSCNFKTLKLISTHDDVSNGGLYKSYKCKVCASSFNKVKVACFIN